MQQMLSMTMMEAAAEEEAKRREEEMRKQRAGAIGSALGSLAAVAIPGGAAFAPALSSFGGAIGSSIA